MLTAADQAGMDYTIQPVPFTQVHFSDQFWAPRLETNRTVTLPYDFQKCEETGRITNFAKAGGRMEGRHEGIFFNDSDVYKIVEGAAYTLALKEDPELDKYLDDLIDLFAAAQEDDGYLYTARTIDPENPPPVVGKERWTNIKDAHELYNHGHMIEAAVAHYQATGKRAMLDVAIRSADLIAREFGPQGRHDPPGHQEIEIALVKLYRVTGDKKYMDLAEFFIDQRGLAEVHRLYGVHYQDHKPVLEQKEAEGHAVRAGYMYSGMADVAALTGKQEYIDAIGALWENVVSAKLYLTGGIGARHEGEAFGGNFELPNKTAYNETCAAIANCLWNHRLFLLHGDAKYMDVFERTLYNGFLAGISLEGNTFFYPNPLEADGKYAFNIGATGRSPWFNCSCCPSNVVRFLPSLPGYVYAVRGNQVYINLYAAGLAKVNAGGNEVTLRQHTRYPWDGDIRIEVETARPVEFELLLRVPGWAQGRPVPSALYTYIGANAAAPEVRLNGAVQALNLQKGYHAIAREWKSGDTIELHLDMPVRRVVCDDRVSDNRGKVALERGPLVYCVEGVDHAGAVSNLILEDGLALAAEPRQELFGGVTVITGSAKAVRYPSPESEEPAVETQMLTAIPYYAWAHRGAGTMAVWLARTQDTVAAPLKPTLASRAAATASHIHSGDSLSALNDQEEAEKSGDHSIPRFTWWSHLGGKEWVQYDWRDPVRISAVEVYWFDDTGRGQCRVPAKWRLLYREGEDWRPVKTNDAFGVKADRYNRIAFEPVTTTALRIEASLRDGFSGGMLEWKVE